MSSVQYPDKFLSIFWYLGHAVWNLELVPQNGQNRQYPATKSILVMAG